MPQKTDIDFDFDSLIEVCKQHHVAWVGLFGSLARGDCRDDSDIDLLVEFSRPQSLLEVVALERQLSEALERKVDLVTRKALSPYLAKRIEKELQTIYEV
jgi:predicted nucleotidyltransferase